VTTYGMNSDQFLATIKRISRAFLWTCCLQQSASLNE